MLQNLQNIAKIQNFQLDNLVDFEKCCKTRIYLQKSAPIQPKMSNILPKMLNIARGLPRRRTAWVVQAGRLNAVETLYSLYAGDETTGEEFYGAWSWHPWIPNFDTVFLSFPLHPSATELLCTAFE